MVNKSELKSACDILGSVEFWDRRRAEPAASVSVSTHGPAWENANTIADACLRLMFLDADGFSRARQYRDRMKGLSAKVSELNETRRRVSGRGGELSDIRRAWSSMAEQGWVEVHREETKKLKLVKEQQMLKLEVMKINAAIAGMQVQARKEIPAE